MPSHALGHVHYRGAPLLLQVSRGIRLGTRRSLFPKNVWDGRMEPAVGDPAIADRVTPAHASVADLHI